MSKKEYVDRDQLFELVYPISSIYLSATATSPTDLFGIGSWEKIEDAFLLASGQYASLGSIGGNENHTLSISEMPAHTHSHADTVAWPLVDNPEREWGVQYYTTSNQKHPYTQWINSTKSTGGGQPFSIMPPYLSINVWKRVD